MKRLILIMNLIMNLKIAISKLKVLEHSILEKEDLCGHGLPSLLCHLFISVIFIIYIIIIGAEFLYQRYPDEDHWKITHPPPLNFPDSEVKIYTIYFFIIGY